MISKKRMYEIYNDIEKGNIQIPSRTLNMLEYELMYNELMTDTTGYKLMCLMWYFFYRGMMYQKNKKRGKK